MFSSCRKKTKTDSDDEIDGIEEVSRRKAFRDDEQATEIELNTRDIHKEDEEIITKALEASPFFMALASKAVKNFAKYMTPMALKEGDVVLKQGEEGNSIYVSKTGKYKIEINDELISHFEDSRLFGELAILYDKPRVATVSAESDGEVWHLTRKEFKTILSSFNITAYEILIEFLAKVPVLNALTKPKLKKIANLCETNYFAKDTQIIRENERGDEFFIIKTGSVIITHSEQGLIKTLELPGDCFGERALLYDDDKRQATITAGEYGVECIILSRNDFNEFLGDFRNFFENDITKPTPETPELKKLDKYNHIELSKLQKMNSLGEGAFGVVEQVKYGKKEFFALKTIGKKKLKDHNLEYITTNETKLLSLCDHPFIINLYNTFEDEKFFYLLLEYCPNGDLFALLHKSKFVFKENHAKFVAAGIAEALIYLHERNCAFLDLKPENICIDSKCYPKLLDFGNAVQLEPGKKTFLQAGTLEYMAPEISQLCGYDMAVDYWALGVLIYEMHMKVTPFCDRNDKNIAINIAKGLTDDHVKNLNDSTADIIQSLMNMNPAKRLGCQVDGGNEIRKHTFFKDIDFVKLREYRVKSPLRYFFKR